MRVGGEVGLGLGRRHSGALGLERAFAFAQRGERLLRRRRQRLQAAVGVDQRAVGRRIDQRALVVLAMDFDQSRKPARAAPGR